MTRICYQQMKSRFKKEFNVDEQQFVLIFDNFVINKINNVFNIDFVKIVNGKKIRDITHTGNSFKILNLMTNLVEECLLNNDDVNPNGFFFIAEEPSRQRLYNRYAKIIVKKYGDKFTKVEDYSKFKLFEDYTDNLFLFIKNDIYSETCDENRKNNLLTIRKKGANKIIRTTIDEFYDAVVCTFNKPKKIYQIFDYEMLTDIGWINLKSIRQKKVKEKMITVTTKNFVLDAVEEQSFTKKKNGKKEKVKLNKIKKGDFILTSLGEEKVINIKKKNKNVEVYDIKLKLPNPHVFVGGIEIVEDDNVSSSSVNITSDVGHGKIKKKKK